MADLLLRLFGAPVFLWLLLGLPLIFYWGRHSLAGLNRGRHLFATCIRAMVYVLVVFALADLQWVQAPRQLAAYFLLDQSYSVESELRERQLDYVATAVRKHRSQERKDLVGVIAFGSDAHLECPLEESHRPWTSIETSLDSSNTNISSAFRLAKRTFPDGAARRVILLSDGNQNLGDALTEAQQLSADGIGIDVALLPSLPKADVVIEKVAAPTNVRAGAPFDVSVIVDNVQPASVRPAQTVSGRLTVIQKSAGVEQILGEREVTLQPGKQVYTFEQEESLPGFFVYEARFTPAEVRQDHIPQNNLATTYTHIRGKGKVLFIVNPDSPTEFDHLITRLRTHEIDVTVQTTQNLFTSIAELQVYDAVVLANVPRTSGDQEASLVHFSDQQVQMLVNHTKELGAGLIMLGGPDSFGAGGWTNTELERAMPVDFQVKNSKVAATGALMLVIDKSGSMSGEKLELSKAAAHEALKMLSPNDYIGLMAFDSGHDEVVKLQKVKDRAPYIDARISRIAEGGGTNMYPGLEAGYKALLKVDASVKHVIVLTDGQTEGTGYENLVSQMKTKGITTTTVAVGPDASRQLLQAMAGRGGGKYYQVTNPRAIPRIFTRETRRVARPLVYESENPFVPQPQQSHKALVGISGPFPAITGFVLTTPKEHPLVETPLLSPVPQGDSYPVMATWSIGLGKAAVLTTDGGARWAKQWTSWDKYDQVFLQLLRWAMRPTSESGDYSMAASVKDGKLRVVLQGLNAKGEFENGLNVVGRVIGENDNLGEALTFEQVAPGRYVAEAKLSTRGSYMLAVSPGSQQPVLLGGVSIPYSPEFKDLQSNESLLISLASLTPRDGKVGEVIRLPDDPRLWSQFTGPNVFRHDLAVGVTVSTIWPWILLASVWIFLLDVMIRRVSISLPGWSQLKVLFSRTPTATVAANSPHLENLKRQKSLLAESPRFHMEILPVPSTEEVASEGEVKPANNRDEAYLTPMEEESYSQRLLRVKRGLHKPQQND